MPPLSDNYPATHFGRNQPPATGSEEVLNLYPIQGAARDLTVENSASEGRALELAENATFGERLITQDFDVAS
jgi:hypothetical protein